MRRMMRVGVLLVLTVAVLTGCGKKFAADTDTVYVQKKGTVKGANVAAFDKDYYKQDELESFINDTVDTYVAKAGEGTVDVTEFAVADGVAHGLCKCRRLCTV